MKQIDAVRGYERTIKFSEKGGHVTGGAVMVSDCVIEVVENAWQGQRPVLSLRSYHPPYSHHLSKEMADGGTSAYDEDTAVGIELSLGPELADSLVTQLRSKWPDFLKALQDEDGSGPGPGDHEQ